MKIDGYDGAVAHTSEEEVIALNCGNLIMIVDSRVWDITHCNKV